MPTFFDENISPSVTQETDAALVSLGQRGAIASVGGGVAGNFAAIQVIEDATFDELTALNSDFSALLSTPTVVPAGTVLYGPFTQVSALSGTYIAYKA